MNYSALINGGEAKRSRKARGSEWTAVRTLERFLQAVQQQPISPTVSMDQPARGTERCNTTTRRYGQRTRYCDLKRNQQQTI